MPIMFQFPSSATLQICCQCLCDKYNIYCCRETCVVHCLLKSIHSFIHLCCQYPVLPTCNSLPVPSLPLLCVCVPCSLNSPCQIKKGRSVCSSSSVRRRALRSAHQTRRRGRSGSRVRGVSDLPKDLFRPICHEMSCNFPQNQQLSVFQS